MHSLNKKGLAEIVSASLIILVSITAIVLMFGIVSNFTTQLSPEISCSEARINPPVSLIKTCQNDENKLEVTLDRLTNTPISNLQFRIDSSSNSVSYGCGQSCGISCSLQDPLEIKKFYLDITTIQNPSQLILSVDGCLMATEQNIPPCN